MEKENTVVEEKKVKRKCYLTSGVSLFFALICFSIRIYLDNFYSGSSGAYGAFDSLIYVALFLLSGFVSAISFMLSLDLWKNLINSKKPNIYQKVFIIYLLILIADLLFIIISIVFNK